MSALALLIASPALAARPTGLQLEIVASRTINDSVIVGRARCPDSRWLLNGARQLMEISPSNRTVAIHPVRGLEREDQPWGLACLTDQTLWMLTTPRTLARVGRDGAIVERLSLPAPWIELFGAGDRLLFERMPPVIASPVLATSRPRSPQASRPWPGLLARTAAARADVLATNLVSCGLANGPTVPCWFPSDTQVVLSDGTQIRRHSFPWIRAADVDPAAPLRDVAFVERGRVWLLATSSRLYQGRRAGGRLLLATTEGREIARIDLDPPARLVLAATDTSCLLLTVRGDLVEVRER